MQSRQIADRKMQMSVYLEIKNENEMREDQKIRSNSYVKRTLQYSPRYLISAGAGGLMLGT